MDRRNLWRVAGRGGGGGALVLSGLVSQLPSAGQPGRVYVVTPISTTSMGGTALPGMLVDSGSAWTRPVQNVYQSSVVTLLSGATTKVMMNFGLKANALMSGRRLDIYVLGRFNGGTATQIAVTPHIVIGTVSWTAWQQSITSTVSAHQDLRMVVRLVGSTTASLGYLSADYQTPSTPGGIMGTASRTWNPSVSQTVKIAVALNKNIANTAFRVRYIGAQWS